MEDTKGMWQLNEMYDPCLDPGIEKKEKEKEYLWRNDWNPNEFCNLIVTELKLNT